MSNKLPAIQWYPGDWRKDPGIQVLDYESRGVWFEILMLMYESEERGKLMLNGLPMTDDDLAVALGFPLAKLQQTLSKLLSKGVASRCQKTGALINRRMLRDENLRKVRAEAGALGGKQKASNAPSKSLTNPTPSSSTSSSTSASPSEKDPSLPTAKRGRKVLHSRKLTLPELPEDARNLATQLKTLILENNPKAIVTNAQILNWTREADRMFTRDSRDPQDAAELLTWAQYDPFWQTNILSMAKFRQQYDQLSLKAQTRPQRQPRSQLPYPDGQTGKSTPGDSLPLCSRCGTIREWHKPNGAGHSLAHDRFQCEAFQTSLLP